MTQQLPAHALAALQRRFVTILGYGEAGAAQALCLRDSGIDVRIGLPGEGPQWDQAAAEGFHVAQWVEAVEEADILVLAMAGPEQAELGSELLADALIPGDTLIVSDGFALRYGALAIPAGVDVVLVSPVGAEHLRREFVEGRGVPMVVAVDRDATGQARTTAVGYAAALGGLRAGIVETTVADAVDALTLGAAVIADAGLPTLMETAFQTLIAHGIAPDLAYLATVQEASSAVERLVRVGPAAYREGLPVWRSWVAANVDLMDGAAADELDALVPQLRDGSLAAQIREQRIPTDQALEAAGQQVRAMMPWLRGGDDTTGRRWR
ncbi:MAG: hypothetical protein ACRCWS_00380 [Propionibacteriaceae bacterium]